MPRATRKGGSAVAAAAPLRTTRKVKVKKSGVIVDAPLTLAPAAAPSPKTPTSSKPGAAGVPPLPVLLESEEKPKLAPGRRRQHVCTADCSHVCATEGCSETLTLAAARSRYTRCPNCRRGAGAADGEATTPAKLKTPVPGKAVPGKVTGKTPTPAPVPVPTSTKRKSRKATATTTTAAAEAVGGLVALRASKRAKRV
jgi:hypothetical protein